MKKIIFSSYRFLRGVFYERPKLISYLLIKNEYYEGETYFPEIKNRKGKLQIFIDQFRHLIKYNELNEYYFLYGLDIKERNSKDYVPYLIFMNRRNHLNKLNNNDAISVLRNKIYFSIIVEKFGFKTPSVLGIYFKGLIQCLNDGKEISLFDFLKERKGTSFFFKSINGERGDGVFKIYFSSDEEIFVNDKKLSVDLVLSILEGERFLIQQQLTQSIELNKLHDKAINTLRLVTIYKNFNKVDILQPILRVGTNDMVVDNWSQGGICINVVGENGNLDEFGYFKPGIGTKSDVHPNSKIHFKNFVIPNYKEAVAQAKELHSFFPEIHSIGWDICFADDGIVFIEGNDNWAINIHQSMNGLKKEFDRLF